jgi:hypothetical protein
MLLKYEKYFTATAISNAILAQLPTVLVSKTVVEIAALLLFFVCN